MSHELEGAPAAMHASTGRVWKWMAGAGVGASLWAGIFCAVASLGFSPFRADVAYTASSAQSWDGQIRTATLIPPSQGALSRDQSIASAAAFVPAAVTSRRRARHAARSRLAPPETAGIVPVSATEEDGMVVHGVKRPIWVRSPSAWNLANAYPERARALGREGEASVHCTVRNSGALNCVSVSETPANAGFGAAAVRVARMYRHTPRRADEDSAEASVNLHIVFRLADNDRAGQSPHVPS